MGEGVRVVVDSREPDRIIAMLTALGIEGCVNLGLLVSMCHL